MFTTIIDAIIIYIQEMRLILKDTQSQLDLLSDYCIYYLVSSMKNGRKYYYCRIHGKSSSEFNKYLGTIDNPDVQRIMRVQFLQRRMEVLQRNIKAATELLSRSGAYDPLAIYNKLPKLYRQLSVLQLSSNPATRSASANGSAPLDIDKWRQDLLALKEVHPPNRPRELNLRTDSGVMVRSKSEQVIANMLFGLGIPFVYEAPLLLNGVWYHPDFTILIPATGKVYYIEHFGFMKEENYAAKHGLTIRAYISEGILPNDQLITSYEGFDGQTWDSQSLRKRLLTLMNEQPCDSYGIAS